MKIKLIQQPHKCDSGITGWKGKLQNQYEDFADFEHCCGIFDNHTRLGYKTPQEAWDANPTIQGSVIPSDYRKSGRLTSKINLVN